MTSLGQRLRQLRKQRGLILADVASSAAVSISYLNDLEHDRNRPSLDVLVRIANTLGLTVRELLRNVEPYDHR